MHGSAPDLAGKGIINPTAMLLSDALLLSFPGYAAQAQALEDVIIHVYREGVVLTPDQGGSASTIEFVAAVRKLVE